eukprot:6836135-Karenia_brevis.AAC.1
MFALSLPEEEEGNDEMPVLTDSEDESQSGEMESENDDSDSEDEQTEESVIEKLIKQARDQLNSSDGEWQAVQSKTMRKSKNKSKMIQWGSECKDEQCTGCQSKGRENVKDDEGED